MQLIATDTVACRHGEDGRRKSYKVFVAEVKKERYRIPVRRFVDVCVARSIQEWPGVRDGTPEGAGAGVHGSKIEKWGKCIRGGREQKGRVQ